MSRYLNPAAGEIQERWRPQTGSLQPQGAELRCPGRPRPPGPPPTPTTSSSPPRPPGAGSRCGSTAPAEPRSARSPPNAAPKPPTGPPSTRRSRPVGRCARRLARCQLAAGQEPRGWVPDRGQVAAELRRLHAELHSPDATPRADQADRHAHQRLTDRADHAAAYAARWERHVAELDQESAVEEHRNEESRLRRVLDLLGIMSVRGTRNGQLLGS